MNGSAGWRAVFLAALVSCVGACGGDTDNAPAPAPLLVLSAFPAESVPLVEQTRVDYSLMVNDRVFRVGVLGGVRVIVGLTGIGLVNATATTRAVLDRFTVSGLIVSGVAGSSLPIADVTVPMAWTLDDGTTTAANQEWLRVASAIATPGTVALEHCTLLPSDPSQDVCLPHQPAIVVGGLGESSDPFGGSAVRCLPTGDDVSGCDIPSAEATTERIQASRRALVPNDTDTPIADDMETAAIAREAAAHGVPFIAFRAVSDGADDPLNLPGFPAQFYAYYRLAARNAAAATIAFLEQLAPTTRR